MRTMAALILYDEDPAPAGAEPCPGAGGAISDAGRHDNLSPRRSCAYPSQSDAGNERKIHDESGDAHPAEWKKRWWIGLARVAAVWAGLPCLVKTRNRWKSNPVPCADASGNRTADGTIACWGKMILVQFVGDDEDEKGNADERCEQAGEAGKSG